MKEYEDTIKNAQRTFANHVAKLTDLGAVKILEWSKPGTRENSIVYTILQDRHLVVTGDYWNAIYTWQGDISFDAVAGYHLGYVYEKLNCLKFNSLYDWDKEKSIAELRCFLEDSKQWGEEESQPFIEDAESCSDEHEWIEFVRTHHDELDCGDGTLYRAGETMPWPVIFHHEGLKMAMNRLSTMEAGRS